MAMRFYPVLDIQRGGCQPERGWLIRSLLEFPASGKEKPWKSCPRK
jgi:hypothetical protein